MPTIRRIASIYAARFLMFGLVALALADCSKCDMPGWRHEGAAPQSCHEGAPPQYPAAITMALCGVARWIISWQPAAKTAINC
jgi:hypothetical protein